MTRQDFFLRIRGMFFPADIDRICFAYWLAKEVHRKQKRQSGERYFEHCRRVAVQILDWGYRDADGVIIGFLHDCEEDGFLPEDVVKLLLGKTVADAVRVLSKWEPRYDKETGRITKEKKSLTYYFAEIAASCWQTQVIKCADRLDNLSTMDVWKAAKQQEYITETEQYIMPIAETLGQRIAADLRALCVR